MKQEKIIEIIYSRLPYSDQITNIDLGESNAVRFEWRGGKFRVSESLGVEQCENSMLYGNNTTLLMSRLLKMLPYEI